MDLQKAKREYERLEKKREDEEIAALQKKKQASIEARQKAICHDLKDSFQVTKVDRHVIARRKQIMAHPEVKFILERYGFSVEDVGLVEWRNEDWDFDFRRQHDNQWLPEVYNESTWLTRKRYIWGGPKDPVQIFFGNIRGNGYHILGVFMSKDAFPKGGVFKAFAKQGRRAP